MAKVAAKKKPSHALITGSERVSLPGAIAIGRTKGATVIEVSVKLRRKTNLRIVKRKPATAMTRKEFAAKYGASKIDVSKAVGAFKRYNLAAVRGENLAARTVRLRGTVANMEEAFKVTLFDYQHPEGDYRGRVGSVHIPTELKNVVVGVFGLDNRRIAKRHRRPKSFSASSAASGVPGSWYLPQELAKHYLFPSGDGDGQAIGVLELGGGYFPADLKQFCVLAKIPITPNVIPVSVAGAPTSTNDDSAGEVMMDIEIVAGICPKSSIVAYFAPNTDDGLIELLDQSIHDATNDPGVLSMSWGGPENSYTSQTLTQINETLKDAAALGVTVCMAAGDDGSSDGVRDGHAHVNYPASSPYALAVGGTTVPVKGGRGPDVVWHEGTGLNDGGAGDGSTGGGVSAVFERPSWQSLIKVTSVNPRAMLGRVIPDISANADWTKSPYLMVVNGQMQANGGTSAATPLIASLLTLTNVGRIGPKRVGLIGPRLYQTMADGKGTIGSRGCTDVVSGNNTTAAVGGYSAASGFDAASGWGTPNGARLAKLL